MSVITKKIFYLIKIKYQLRRIKFLRVHNSDSDSDEIDDDFFSFGDETTESRNISSDLSDSDVSVSDVSSDDDA
jgi:hypothetical protein